ncbi:MAG: ferredoxin [Patescibacteria group bacterium]
MSEIGLNKRKIIKVVVDRALCIGAASCIAVAPDVFALDSENIAVVKADAPLDDDMLLLAAQSCPTNAIFLYDEEGKQVYPSVN